MLNKLLHELHNLRKHIRDSQQEIEKVPRLHKAYQTKVANHLKALNDAKDELKKKKVKQLDSESRLKTLNQNLTKFEKQLNEAGSPKEYEGKQTEIKNTKELIATLEDETLNLMTAIETDTAKIPALEAAYAKVTAELAQFETDSKERVSFLKNEITQSTQKLAEEEKKIPAPIKSSYDRLIKSYGADALVLAENQTCSHCHTTITIQHVSELKKEMFVTCKNCGRGLYMK